MKVVGILDSICSAMSYVAGFYGGVSALIECSACTRCTADVTGLGLPFSAMVVVV